MPSLWLVDGSHTIFRAYHALPHLSTRQGVPTNAVYGFTTMLLRAIREGSPTHLAVAFDEVPPALREAADIVVALTGEFLELLRCM